MSSSLKCVSFNIQGLLHVNKWRLFWDYVNTMHPHVVCLQEHNQHRLASQSGFFAGYHIFYAGSTNFSGVVMLIHHKLNPHLAYNDSDGRWMVIQCIINVEIYDFAGVYASQSSRMRALLWSSLSTYLWLSNAFICGDFNNSPSSRDNTSQNSHMLQIEKQRWLSLLEVLHAEDLWLCTNPINSGFTFTHNASARYQARLDRWYLLNANPYNSFIRVCGRFLNDIVAALLEQVQEQFQQHHQSCFLYLASEVMKVFSEDPSCASYLSNLVFVLFGQAINLLSSIEAFTAHPDIADDCFLLASRCIRYCPHLLLPTPVFPALIDCALTGVTIQHREACYSILTFLQDILNLCSSVTGQHYKDVIDSALLPRGPNLCRILIGALVGAVPESRVEEVMGVILSLAQTYGMTVVQWAASAVHLIPATVASEEEQKAFLRAMTSAASGGESAALRNSIEELSDVCRRSKRSLELVQSVLRPYQLTLTC
ncbi:hypothetical protein L7F22_068798 [Adiantum nelumboides]|nr:hypothetical protein [Adiantum nelumboides]